MEISTSQPTVSGFDNNLLDRMVRAVEKVRERLRRATLALDAAKLPYAVVGGNAVAAWVSQVDPGAARNTADIDLLVNRCDFDRIKQSLTEVGFVYRELMGVPMFLDGETGSPKAQSRNDKFQSLYFVSLLSAIIFIYVLFRFREANLGNFKT